MTTNATGNTNSFKSYLKCGKFPNFLLKLYDYMKAYDETLKLTSKEEKKKTGFCFISGAIVFEDNELKLFHSLVNLSEACKKQDKENLLYGRFGIFTGTHSSFFAGRMNSYKRITSTPDSHYPLDMEFKNKYCKVGKKTILGMGNKGFDLQYQYVIDKQIFFQLCDIDCSNNNCTEDDKEAKGIILFYPFQVNTPGGGNKKYLYIKLEGYKALDIKHQVGAIKRYFLHHEKNVSHPERREDESSISFKSEYNKKTTNNKNNQTKKEEELRNLIKNIIHYFSGEPKILDEKTGKFIDDFEVIWTKFVEYLTEFNEDAQKTGIFKLVKNIPTEMAEFFVKLVDRKNKIHPIRLNNTKNNKTKKNVIPEDIPKEFFERSKGILYIFKRDNTPINLAINQSLIKKQDNENHYMNLLSSAEPMTLKVIRLFIYFSSKYKNYEGEVKTKDDDFLAYLYDELLTKETPQEEEKRTGNGNNVSNEIKRYKESVDFYNNWVRSSIEFFIPEIITKLLIKTLNSDDINKDSLITHNSNNEQKRKQASRTLTRRLQSTKNNTSRGQPRNNLTKKLGNSGNSGNSGKEFSTDNIIFNNTNGKSNFEKVQLNTNALYDENENKKKLYGYINENGKIIHVYENEFGEIVYDDDDNPNPNNNNPNPNPNP
jgi:hypothetical protein